MTRNIVALDPLSGPQLAEILPREVPPNSKQALAFGADFQRIAVRLSILTLREDSLRRAPVIRSSAANQLPVEGAFVDRGAFGASPPKKKFGFGGR